MPTASPLVGAGRLTNTLPLFLAESPERDSAFKEKQLVLRGVPEAGDSTWKGLCCWQLSSLSLVKNIYLPPWNGGMTNEGEVTLQKLFALLLHKN